jgi:hypothetical protein
MPAAVVLVDSMLRVNRKAIIDLVTICRTPITWSPEE